VDVQPDASAVSGDARAPRHPHARVEAGSAPGAWPGRCIVVGREDNIMNHTPVSSPSSSSRWITRSAVASLGLLFASAGAGAGVGATREVTVGAAKSVTVTSRATQQRDEVDLLSTGDGDLYQTDLSVALRDGERHLTVTSDAAGSVVTLTYDSPTTRGSRTIVDGVVTRDTLDSSAVVRDVEILDYAIQEYDQFPDDYVIEGGDPTVAINWKCEIATLKALTMCGMFLVAPCGQAVFEQMCACAPTPKPDGC
jgi:hypothetical protein